MSGHPTSDASGSSLGPRNDASGSSLGPRSHDFWSWVASHIADDPTRLRLKFGATRDREITQIECRRRFAKKLADTLAADPEFYFPSRLAGEQSTSDSLAAFHASLILPNQPVVDLTSGLGIDISHCSANASSAVAVERDPAVADALAYNLPRLAHCPVKVICADCRDYITSLSDSAVGTIFIDPARRAADGSRVFALSDCEPDVVAMLPRLSTLCRRLVIKMSPMLDISQTLSALTRCSRIIALGTATECKELIAVIDFDEGVSTEPTIESVTISSTRNVSFAFKPSEIESLPPIPASDVRVGDYIYEPYPSMMKINAGRSLAARFGLEAFHSNTKLYHSSTIAAYFPGEIFEIEQIVDFASRNIKRLHRDYPTINITTRNFDMTADALRKKLGVRDGGDRRLFAVTDHSGRRIMIITHPNQISKT